MVVRIVRDLTDERKDTLQKAVLKKGGFLIREEQYTLQLWEIEYERTEMPWDEEGKNGN